MDDNKLERLRQRYGGDKAEFYEGKFRSVAERLLKRGKRRQPFTGISTFLDVEQADLSSDLDVALIGVPMDLGVTNRSGARFGPRAVRDVERIGPYNHVLDLLPLDALQVADIGDVPFRSRFSLKDSLEDIETCFDGIAAAGVLPLAVGGDHSITHPILKAVGKAGPVGLVHIDAHCDTSGPYEGEKFHHGGPFRHAVLDGVLDPERTIQIGIRGSSEWLWEFSYESGMSVIHMEKFAALGVAGVIAAAREVIGDGAYYISIDVDGIDPAFTPGTGTPEVGGLTPFDVQTLLRGLAGLNLVGGDVVEVAPQYDANTNTAQVAAQLVFEILSLMAVGKG